MTEPDKYDITSYFTVDFNLIARGIELPYTIYVNSSGAKLKARFVKIVRPGEILDDEMVEGFKKYRRVYVAESDRKLYLQSLVHSDKAEDIEKITVIKDSAIQYLDDIFNPNKEFNTEILGEALEGCHESMKSMVGVIRDYDINNLKELIGDLSFHDFYTYDHSINVSMYSVLIYRHLKPNAPDSEAVSAGLGGLLHDLGKIKIPTEILNNTDALTDEEFETIKTHPQLGAKLFDESNPDFPGADKEAIRRVIIEHHENIDGTGYPNKLKGDQLHLFSKVVAIADFFDAVTTKRSYSDVLAVEDALAVMERTVGKKLDAKLFDFFQAKVAKVVLNGKAGIELPENFDTERAHEKLPIQKAKPKILGSNFTKKED
jgi:HD-GYP domain-containing protein (c-di-GMP phosphodiesterase class II)